MIIIIVDHLYFFGDLRSVIITSELFNMSFFNLHPLLTRITKNFYFKSSVSNNSKSKYNRENKKEINHSVKFQGF